MGLDYLAVGKAGGSGKTRRGSSVFPDSGLYPVLLSGVFLPSKPGGQAPGALKMTGHGPRNGKRRKNGYGYILAVLTLGWFGFVPLWNETDVRWFGSGGWRQNAPVAGGADKKPLCGRRCGHRCNDVGAEFQRHHGDGRWVCQCGSYEPFPGLSLIHISWITMQMALPMP